MRNTLYYNIVTIYIMSIVPNRFPGYQSNYSFDIKDPTVADNLEDHIKDLEKRLQELHKTQHTWLITNPTVVPDSDPDFRALRQVIKKVQLDLEMSKRNLPQQKKLETTFPTDSFTEEQEPARAQQESSVVSLPSQRQKSRFMMRR